MTERMTTQDIVKNSTEIKESGLDWERVYYALHKSIESGEYRMIRHGDTLFWYHIDEPKVAQMYVFNADSYKNLFKNMKEFAMAMHKSGFKKVYGETHDMNMIKLIERIGFPVDVEEKGKDDQGRQIYRGTVNV
jgi:hypothetical protein